jgi:hypothetical protein
MTWPTPQVGQVISYSYLWKAEFDQGRESGAKDRPCAVVAAITVDEDKTDVYVLPITHSLPSDPTAAVELPALLKSRLGLDTAPSWIIVSEWNRFRWPGPDIRLAPGKGAIYGWLTQGVLDQVKRSVAERVRAKLMRTVPRTE